MLQPPEYTSKIPFEADDHLDGLMLVCSDGRFENHVDDFRKYLVETMELRRLDRYFVPGAQLQFLSREAGYPDADLTTGFWARFFIDHHHTGKVIIIGHEHCAAYRFAPAYQKLSDDELRERQNTDLTLIRDFITDKYPSISVYIYYMRPTIKNNAVEFFRVE